MATSDDLRVLHVLHEYFESLALVNEDDPQDAVHRVGRASHCLLYSLVYTPTFGEVGGHVFLQWSLDVPGAKDRIRRLLDQPEGDLGELIRSFNWIEVEYLFGPGGQDADGPALELLAERIAAGWRGALAVQYPQRSFVVEVLSPAVTGSSVGVGFYEE